MVVSGLVFPATLRNELISDAQAGAPDEVCGILAGRADRIEHVLPVRNTADAVTADTGFFRDRASGQPADGRRAVHYFMDPQDQFRVYKEIWARDLDVIGYYHSHTHTEARPSPTDVRLATDLSAYYVLVSLQDAQQPVVRAWRIVKSDPMDETGELIEIELGA